MSSHCRPQRSNGQLRRPAPPCGIRRQQAHDSGLTRMSPGAALGRRVSGNTYRPPGHPCCGRRTTAARSSSSSSQPVPVNTSIPSHTVLPPLTLSFLPLASLPLSLPSVAHSPLHPSLIRARFSSRVRVRRTLVPLRVRRTLRVAPPTPREPASILIKPSTSLHEPTQPAASVSLREPLYLVCPYT